MDVFCQVSDLLRRYDQYVHDLRRLFIFHGLTCGTADDFSSLARKLQDSSALRIDLPALLSNIRDIEHNRISANEMLTILALASGGVDFVEGRSASIGTPWAVELFNMLLAGIGSWGEGSRAEEMSHGEEFAPANAEAAQPAAPLRHAIDELRMQLGEIARRLEDLEPASTSLPHTLLHEPDGWATLGTHDEPPGERASVPGMPIPLQVITERAESTPAPALAFGHAALSGITSGRMDDGTAPEAEGPEQQAAWSEIDVPSAEWAVSEAASMSLKQSSSTSRSTSPAASVNGDRNRDLVSGATRKKAPLQEVKSRITRIRALRIAAALVVTLGLSDLLWSALRKEGGTAEARVVTAAMPSANQPHGATPVDPRASPTPIEEQTVRVPRLQAPEAVPKSAQASTPETPRAPVQAPLAKKPQTIAKDDLAGHQKSLPAQLDSGGKTNLPIEVPASVLNKNLISSRKPTYPLNALQQHLSGRVTLNAFISREGSVRRMDVVEGSPLFIQSAISAVSWRRYKPYLLRGRPVEVITRITVNYPRL